MLKLTPSGMDLLLRTIAGEATIDFAAVQLGNGADAGGSAAALSNPLLTAEISKYEIGDIFVTLTYVFSNGEVEAGFRATELGVLAKDPDAPERTLLYAYAYTPDDQADYIPASADKVLETQLDVLVYIGDAQNVTASISESLVYASKAALDAHMEDNKNPHKVSKEQVGLGNVPNVATNDQTPTYTTPAAPAALSSGEKLSTAMGKIARAVLSLISHLADRSNPHKVTAAQAGAAASSHKHSATDITSGTLGVSRGGTGVSSYEALRNKLGVNCKAERLQTGALTNLGNYWMAAWCRMNGIYVVLACEKGAMADQAIFCTSEDGLRWTVGYHGADDYLGIACGNGIFLAVGINKIAYSTDGKVWSEIENESGVYGSRGYLTYGKGLFVSFPGGNAASSGYLHFWTSKDGVAWTQHNTPVLQAGDGYLGVSYGNGKFVAVTYKGYVSVSDDGVSWTALQKRLDFVDADNTKGLELIYSKVLKKWLCCVQSSAVGMPAYIQVAVSNYDPSQSWTVQKFEDISISGPNEQIMTDGNALVLKVSGNQLLVTNDGFTWSLVDVPDVVSASLIISGEGRFLAVSEDLVMTSIDGQLWKTDFFRILDFSGNEYGILGR